LAWWVLVLVGCGQSEPLVGGAGEALEEGTRWASAAPAWVPAARSIEDRNGARLLGGSAERAPDQTDLRPARPLVVHDARRDLYLLPPEAVWVGALTRDGVLWVTTRGDLLHDDGVAAPRTIASNVIPEIAVDPTSTFVAFARGPGNDAGVYVVELAANGAAPRRVTPGLAVADRPLFVDDTMLLITGARPGGIAGLWTLRHREVDVALRPLTNATLRAGAPLGPTFIPPPAYHASMRIEDEAVLYHDGRAERRVPLTPEAPR
jgi:hypothetical protein